MGNSASARLRSRARPAPDELLHTKPSGLYGNCAWDPKHVARLIVRGELAPRVPGADARDDSAPEECPICLLAYPALNAARCCAARLCTECYLQLRPPRGPKPPCPFCKHRRLDAVFRGPRSPEELAQEQADERRAAAAAAAAALRSDDGSVIVVPPTSAPSGSLVSSLDHPTSVDQRESTDRDGSLGRDPSLDHNDSLDQPPSPSQPPSLGQAPSLERASLDQPSSLERPASLDMPASGSLERPYEDIATVRRVPCLPIRALPLPLRPTVATSSDFSEGDSESSVFAHHITEAIRRSLIEQ